MNFLQRRSWSLGTLGLALLAKPAFGETPPEVVSAEQTPAATTPSGDTPTAPLDAAANPASVASHEASPVRVEPVPPEAAPKSPPSDANASAPARSEEKAATPDFRFHGAPGKGATVEFGDAFSLNVKTRIQVRYQLETAPESDTRELLQTVNIGTARLWFSGHAFSRDLTYMVQLAVADRDYRDGATSPVYDAFLDYRAHRDFSVKVGQYFVPFDRLRTVREFALQMADRPVPVQQLTLDRDVGITFYSDSFLDDDSPVAVRLGAFGGGGTNLTLGKEPGMLAVGRVELRPLGKIDDDSEGDLERRRKPALAIGAGVARNWNTNRVRSTTGATYSEGVVSYLHAAVDAVFKWRGLAVQGELLWREADRDRLELPAGAPAAYAQSGRGFVAQASYTFDPPFELVGRLSGLDAFEDSDPRFVALAAATGREVGAGVNYYLNGHKFKIQADWIARCPSNYDLANAQQVGHVQLDVTF